MCVHVSLKSFIFQGHRRMVCSVAWLDENNSMPSNLFTCGFDRLVLGWRVNAPSKDDTKLNPTKTG